MRKTSQCTHNGRKKINMTEKIASQLQETYNNKGRTAKHLIPQGRIPDLGWNMDQQGKERQKLPNITPEATVTQTTPEQVEGPPSSRLHSKTNITTPSKLMDPPERNPKNRCINTGQSSAYCS